jgi:predicted amino acid racemase
VRNKIVLQSLLAKKEKLFEVLEGKNVTLTFDLVREQLKNNSLEKDCIVFRSTCKVAANQVVTGLNITISTLKEVAKSNEKLTQTLLKSKDVKYKVTFTLYQKNLKTNTKLLDQIQDLHKKLNVHVIMISNLNG